MKIGMTKNKNCNSVEAFEKQVQSHPLIAKNLAGGVAFDMNDPSVQLLHMAAGSFFNEKTFYENEAEKGELQETAKDLIEVAKKVATRQDGHESDLVKIAAWLRDPIHGAKVRTTPQVLMAIAANQENTRKYVRDYIQKTVMRADEVQVLFAAFQHLFGEYQKERPWKSSKLPASLKRGLMDAVLKFNEYEWAKNIVRNQHPSMKDVLRSIDLTSKGRENWNDQLIYWLMNEKVPHFECTKCGALSHQSKKCDRCDNEVFSPISSKLPVLHCREEVFKMKTFDNNAKTLAEKAKMTWETLVSHFGSKPEIWEFAINNGMGYMAMLRNLNNFLSQNINSKTLDKVLNIIGDKEQVLRSKQLPYRFYTAYEMIRNNALVKNQSKVLNTLSIALDYSIANMDEIPGVTAVLIDVSGSMDHKVSHESIANMCYIAALMGSLVAAKSKDSIPISFATTAQYRPVLKNDSIITNMYKLADSGQLGGSTIAYRAIDVLITQNVKVDRVVLISDMQCYGNNSVAATWKAYKAKLNRDAWFHSINLNSNKFSVTPAEGKVNLLSGFSEQIIPMILNAEAVTSNESVSKNIPSLDWIRSNY